jgi:hypothetical protein
MASIRLAAVRVDESPPPPPLEVLPLPPPRVTPSRSRVPSLPATQKIKYIIQLCPVLAIHYLLTNVRVMNGFFLLPRKDKTLKSTAKWSGGLYHCVFLLVLSTVVEKCVRIFSAHLVHLENIFV